MHFVLSGDVSFYLIYNNVIHACGGPQLRVFQDDL